MTKKELEAYAALILINTTQICRPLSTDWLRDKPDLQIGNFGIEVTEAIDKKEGEQRHWDLKVLECETYDNANKFINNLRDPNKFNSEIMQLPNSDRFSLVDGGGYDDKRSVTYIINAIKYKSNKFIKYPDFKKFSRRGLYIIDHELRPCSNYLDIELVRKAVKDSVFDVVFVHQWQRLVVIEKDFEETKEFPLDIIDRNEAICEAKGICGSPDYNLCFDRAAVYKKLKNYLTKES